MSTELQQLKEWIESELEHSQRCYEEQSADCNDQAEQEKANIVMVTVQVSLGEVINKIDEMMTKNAAQPFVSNGDWIEETSSGFLGYRCRKCFCWKYPNEEKRCSCDHVNA